MVRLHYTRILEALNGGYNHILCELSLLSATVQILQLNAIRRISHKAFHGTGPCLKRPTSELVENIEPIQFSRSPQHLSIFLLVPWVVIGASTVSIENSPDFAALRSCTAFCFIYCSINFLDAILMAHKMSCSNNLDSCYCRTDLIPSGVEYLSQCVYTACSGDTVDVASTINL